MKAARLTLARVIAGSAPDGVRPNAQQIAAYIVQEHRTLELESILRDVQQVWASEGYIEVIAETAHPLPESAKADIMAEARKLYPAATKVIITEQRRPELLAGVRLRIVEYVLDASARRSLQRFNTLAAHGKDAQ